MNIFLQFKNRTHADAYKHDFNLQLRKRAAMSTLGLVLIAIGNGIIYGINPNVGPTISKVLIAIRLSACLITLIGTHCAKRKAKRISSHIQKVNIFLDITASLATLVVYPLAGNLAIDSFTKLGVYLWSWSSAFAQLTINYSLANWWMRAMVALTQLTFFMVFLFQREPNHTSIFIFTLQCVLFYLGTIYLQERFNRIDFLEKRKIYDNYEAIMKIFDDISQGIMIVDQENEIIYANRPVCTFFGQDSRSLSLATISSQIHVKSISPQLPTNTLNTERVILNQEQEQEQEPRVHNLLREDLETIKKALFDPEFGLSSISIESYWQNPLIGPQRTHLSIKFTASLFMDKRVFVINMTDTTDRDSLIAAQASSEYKTRLLSSVSHELRTPLNGSINFIEEALNEPQIPKTIKEKWLTPALRCNRLLLSLVNDILDFSQIHAGKLRLCFEPRNVVQTAKECIELLELQAAKKNLSLQLVNNLSPREEILFTDHNRLRQVILNLLSNSVKFTFTGSVALVLDPLSIQRPCMINRRPANVLRGVRITCRDTGIGISPSNQEKLFKIFEKIELENRSAVNPTGAGLGLVISNNIVQRLSPKELTGQDDDFLKFESIENVETKFYFEVYNRDKLPEIEPDNSLNDSSVCSEARVDALGFQELARKVPTKPNQIRNDLPRSNTNQAQTNSSSIPPNYLVTSQTKISCKCPKVLIVDDDAFNLTALDQILSKYGISCNWAFNGQEAIEKIISRKLNLCCTDCQQYKIAFLDVQMPVLNGLETARILRKMIKNKEIDDLRIIACTAFVQESDEIEARAAGMDAFCTKPIVAAVIKERLVKFNLFSKI